MVFFIKHVVSEHHAVLIYSDFKAARKDVASVLMKNLHRQYNLLNRAHLIIENFKSENINSVIDTSYRRN